MKQYGKKLTALLLTACMLLALVACGKKDNGSTDQLTGTVYVPEFIKCELDVDYVNAGCCDGTYIYVIGDVNSQIVREEETGEIIRTLTDEELETGVQLEEGTYIDYIYETKIFRVSMDGAQATPLENYEMPAIPEGMEGSCYISNLRPGADGTLWVTEQMDTYYFDLPADFNPEMDDRWNYYVQGESGQRLRQLDSTGSELAVVNTTGLTEKLEADYYNYLIVDNSGNLVVSVDGRLVVLDQSMNILFEIKEENLWGQLTLLSDGTVGMVCSVLNPETEYYGNVMRVVDMEAKGWGEEYSLPMNAYNAYTGGGDYLFYYENGDSLYGMRKDSKEGEKLLSWSSADINTSDMMFFSFLPDGRVVAMTRDWESNSPSYELAILTETDASVLADKTILTYATMYLSYDIRAKIIDFNRSNTKYRIEIRDYSEYNTEQDYTAGLTKLNTEIVAGNIPDMLDTANIPIRQYGARDVLEDLWPYIENDPELGRDALMEKPLQAVEQDGKLYQIFNTFSISTVAGAPEVVGDEMSWTLADMQAAMEKMPEGCQYLSQSATKSGMLSTVMNQNLNSFVDWTTGECSFNSPNFISMLEFCNSFPLEFDWEKVDWDEYEDEYVRIQNGKQMLYQVYLYDFQSIQMYKALFGGELTFVGYPKEDGSVGSSFNVGSGMAMSSTCKDKEGAWSFMRQMLMPQSDSDEYFYGGQFYINKKDFDLMAEQAMEKNYLIDENGNTVLDENGDPVEESQGGWGIGELVVDIYATSQEEYDQILALYNAVDTVATYDESIYNIIVEVVEPYFNGDKDVQTTANEIQSRVKLYVNENR